MIIARDLVVSAGGKTILGPGAHGVDLDVPTGSVTGIIGPNGSGKSTLLRALIHAVPLDRGDVVLDGDPLAHMRRRDIARRVAYVGQHAEVVDVSATVADEVALGLALTSVRGAGAIDTAIVDSLDAVGMADHAASPLASLSGGELQRVALARAFAQRADHVLLDEPTNHLDIRHRLHLLDLVRRIAPTVVIVLHDLDLAARVCDSVVLLDAGRVVEAGPVERVLTPAVLDDVYGVRTLVHHVGGRMLLGFDLPATDAPRFPTPDERNHP